MSVGSVFFVVRQAINFIEEWKELNDRKVTLRKNKVHRPIGGPSVTSHTAARDDARHIFLSAPKFL